MLALTDSQVVDIKPALSPSFTYHGRPRFPLTDLLPHVYLTFGGVVTGCRSQPVLSIEEE
jgi:hypothetical protein